MPDAFLVVDKPSGITSHDVVAQVRKAVGVRRVGHAGTLDPMATGVVVVAIGRVTRLIRFIQEMVKEYVATVQFGVSTDSLDADGAVLEREPMPIDEVDVIGVLDRFTGEIEQVPPMVSAIKMGGRRLYEIARQGQTLEREARQVTVHELELTDFVPGSYPQASLRVVCGKGTYVRSLAADIAAALGGRAHLIELRRTRIGHLDLSRAVQVEALDDYRSHLIDPADALATMPSVMVDSDIAAAVGNGVKFATGPVGGIEPGQDVVVLSEDGRLLAVYRKESREAKPEVVLG